MTRSIKINEKISLDIIDAFGDSTVRVLANGNPVHVCKVYNTGMKLGIGYKYNEFYLVIFSKDTSKEPSVSKIEAVYDMVKNQVVPVTKENSEIFKYMCMCKKEIDVAVILQFLNEEELIFAEEQEVSEFIKYITLADGSITRKEVEEYILKQYPGFAKYTNLTSELSIIEYRRILSDFNAGTCEFHVMPRILKDLA